MTRQIQQTTETGKAALALLETFPTDSSVQLARVAFARHPDLFNSLDHARCTIRYYRGSRGKRLLMKLNRGATKGKHISTYQERIEARLPDSAEEFKWRTVPITSKSTLVLSDIHARFHDKIALSCALNEGSERDCDCVLFNGDLFDFYELSKFDRRRSMDCLKETLSAGFEILFQTRKLFPKARIIFKHGNHDDRWADYIHRKGPELFALKVESLEWVINHPSLWGGDDSKAKNLRLEVVADPVPLTIGALYIWHGHEYAKGTANSPVNAARNVFLKTLECGLAGHQHQSSSHSETTAGGKSIGCWSSGCLCNLHPRYAPVNRFWRHGFAIVDYNGGKNFTVHKKTVIQCNVY